MLNYNMYSGRILKLFLIININHLHFNYIQLAQHLYTENQSNRKLGNY